MKYPTLCLTRELQGTEAQAFTQAECEQYQTGNQGDLLLHKDQNGLFLHWQMTDKTLEYRLNHRETEKYSMSFPASKKQAVNQALGRKSRSILDASAGFGSDAMQFIAQGYKVTLLERHPLMYVLLVDLVERINVGDWAQRNQVVVSKPVYADLADCVVNRLDWLRQFDCIYFDPMFPEKPHSSALPNKKMQLLQAILNQDNDAAQVLSSVLQGGVKRVVVKRPDYASALLPGANQRFSAKLLHYDVYHTGAG